MIHLHCIIHSVAYTSKVVAKVKANQGAESVFLVTKSYRSIDITIGKKTETWDLWRVIKWLNTQEVASFTAHFLSSIAAVLMLRLDKSTTVKWVVWGGDFYDLPQVKAYYSDKGHADSISLKQKLGYKLITQALARIDSIIANPCDQGEISTYLNLSAHRATLNFLLDASQLTPLNPLNDQDKVLIGNSDDPNNRHLVVVDQLAKIDSLDDSVIPLSGVNNSYTSSLKSTIAEIYPSASVDYLDSYIEESNYFDLLSSCSHLAFGHLRQQGMGTLFSFLISDRVCYMQSRSPYYQYLIKEGVTIYPLDLIKQGVPEITRTESTNNKRLIAQLFDTELIDSQWKKALTYLKPRNSE